MILPDVNVLLYAFRSDSKQHKIYLEWLRRVLGGNEPFGMSPQVLSSVIRVATNPRIYVNPNSPPEVWAFAEQIVDHPNCRLVQPGRRHWSIFRQLCLESNVSGNLVPDAWFAALAIEHGCEWITADQVFGRFSGLRWRTVK